MLLVGRAEGLERQEDFCLTILRTIQEGSIGCFKAKLLVHHPRKIVRALVSERGKRDKGQPCGPTIDFARHRWRCEAAMAVHHPRYFIVNFFGLLDRIPERILNGARKLVDLDPFLIVCESAEPRCVPNFTLVRVCFSSSMNVKHGNVLNTNLREVCVTMCMHTCTSRKSSSCPPLSGPWT